MSLQPRIGMDRKTGPLLSRADASTDGVERAPAASLAKTMMMPITTPLTAGRTRAS